MKVQVVSDTHCSESLPLLPPCDLLIHCGDGTRKGRENEIKDLRAWLVSQPARHRIFVPGNHDALFYQDPSAARALMSGVEVLIDQGTTFEGLRIWGSPWTPRYGNYAFMLDSEKQARAHWAAMPPALDILITHGPPKHILDLTEKEVHAGCRQLLLEVHAKAPRYHFFGHIHEDGQRIYQGDPTTFCNAAILTRYLEPHDHILPAFDIQAPDLPRR